MRSITIILCLLAFGCKSQDVRVVGGPCEGCEALLEYGDRHLSAIDTIQGFIQFEAKLKVEGTIYKPDGQTPASGVILYMYQTDPEGIYSPSSAAKGWERRHGQYRGWIKTDNDGKYTFYTFRPGAYPDREEPEHIHLTVKEPSTIPYYIDDIMFKDDPLLSKAEIASRPNRGGSGISLPIKYDSLLVVSRNIYLGKNIPNY